MNRENIRQGCSKLFRPKERSRNVTLQEPSETNVDYQNNGSREGRIYFKNKKGEYLKKLMSLQLTVRTIIFYCIEE
jgi:hypothetical protein